MKLVYFTILSLFLLPKLWASDLNFSYSYELPSKNNFNLDLYEISKTFEEKNFNRLSAFPSGNLPLVHADEVMYSNYHKGLIFIKTSLLAPESLRYKVIAAEGFFLYHTDTASMAFFDFNKEEVLSLTNSLKLKKVSKTNFFNLLIPTASANSDIACNTKTKDSFTHIENLNQALGESLLIKTIGECALSALKGVEGEIDSTVDFFKKLKNNPTQLWTEMKESYVQLKHFITNFSSELKQIYASISDLSAQEKLDIACTLTGQMAPGIAMMMTGAGIAAGTSKLILGVTPKLYRLQRLLTQFKRFRLSSEVARESLSCAL